MHTCDPAFYAPPYVTDSPPSVSSVSLREAVHHGGLSGRSPQGRVLEFAGCSTVFRSIPPSLRRRQTPKCFLSVSVERQCTTAGCWDGARRAECTGSPETHGVALSGNFQFSIWTNFHPILFQCGTFFFIIPSSRPKTIRILIYYMLLTDQEDLNLQQTVLRSSNLPEL